MRLSAWMPVFALTATLGLAQAALAADEPAPAPKTDVTLTADAVDPLMGEYEGTCTLGDTPAKAEAKVYPVAGGQYRIALTVTPADAAAAPGALTLTGQKQDKTVVPVADAKPEWTGSIADGKIAGTVAGAKGGTLDLKKVTRHSPTEGQKPPEGAVVLLPLTDGPTSMAEWVNRNWKALPDGSMEAAKGDNRTLKSFGDARIHLEFMTPYEPNGSGQGRGNSGVYLQERYEIQVLDSFGLKPGGGDCAAIYQLATPKINPSLPPLTWQTYDITFKAARFDADGKVTSNPRVTLIFNGVKIHDDVELTAVTGGAMGKTAVPKAPLRLQYHEHPVRFRNIWVVE